jgi:hypothetical protein
MNKIEITKAIAKMYFILALSVSFLHLVHAGFKGGLTWESYLIPFMVDGIAIMGMVMRGSEFASKTRKIGFRTQLGAGFLSLLGNVYAAHNIAGMMMGVAVVTLFIFAEWLTDQIHSAAAEAEERAIAEAKRIEAELAAETQAKKAAAIAKGKATRAKNARTKKAQVRVLEDMLTK